jgi:hypothetical protein
MAIFDNMDGLENKYLQKVNLEALQKETGMSLPELAKLAEIGPKVIYKWAYMHKDSSRPTYNALVKLIEKGASVETLFGVEYKGPVKPPVIGGQLPPELANNPEFAAGQQRALKDIESKIEARITAKLKAKGIDL